MGRQLWAMDNLNGVTNRLIWLLPPLFGRQPSGPFDSRNAKIIGIFFHLVSDSLSKRLLNSGEHDPFCIPNGLRM